MSERWQFAMVQGLVQGNNEVSEGTFGPGGACTLSLCVEIEGQLMCRDDSC